MINDVTPIGVLFLVWWVLILQFVKNNIYYLVDAHWNQKHWPDGHKRI